MDMASERKEYQEGFLSAKELLPDPFDQVKKWINEAMASGEIEPTAACLATSTAEGKVSSRMVLLKQFSENGAYFFTHTTSKKGEQLKENPYASLTIYWKSLERQIILEGPVERLSQEIVDDYFSKRPRKSQLGALASHQGEVLQDRKVLLNRYQDLEKEYEDKEIPTPPSWGGYALQPVLIEIWQGRPSRLHDHFSYRKSGSRWILERISP